MNNILESISKVVLDSKKVKINQDKIKEFCHTMDPSTLKHWTHSAPFDFTEYNEEQKAAFLFIFNSISFSYWGKPKWELHSDKFTRGTFSLIFALQKAVENKIPLLNPLYLSKITKKDINQILKGNTEIPLLEERVKILKELGKVVILKYNSQFKNILNSNDTVELTKRIVEDFPSFQDHTKYNSKKICFYKRVQLLVSDLNYVLNLNLRNIDRLTSCADYILPMALKYYNILEYSPDLEKKITSGTILNSESKEEIEIRANTVWAVELIKKELQTRGINLTSMQINDLLWIAGEEIKKKEKYHLVRSIWY